MFRTCKTIHTYTGLVIKGWLSWHTAKRLKDLLVRCRKQWFLPHCVYSGYLWPSDLLTLRLYATGSSVYIFSTRITIEISEVEDIVFKKETQDKLMTLWRVWLTVPVLSYQTEPTMIFCSLLLIKQVYIVSQLIKHSWLW